MALRCRHIFVYGVGGGGDGRAERVNDGLEIVVVLLEREKESVSFVAAEWARKGPLFHVAAFGRLAGGKKIAGVENGIASQEVYRSVVGGRARLGGDFHAGAAGAGESCRIGILIDFHF